MFNLKPIESGVFDKQIVFNLLPQIGEVLDDGYTMEEAKLAWESARILANDDLLLNATCVRVPVFHGHGMVLHLETKHLLELEQARDLLANAPAVRLVADDDYPTAVTCAVGEDAVFVGRLRRDPTHAKGLNLWLVADNVRKGAALNSIQIAEILIKDLLN